MTEEGRYLLGLSLIDRIGPVLSRQLINHFGTAKEVFGTAKDKLSKVNGLGEKLSQSFKNSDQVLTKADAIINKSVKADIAIHTYIDESFPKRLINSHDGPIILYSKGNVDLNPEKSLGIVGTRKATRYGLKTTTGIVEGLKPTNATIVSGLAYGIDVQSHQSAVDQNLSTIGVLACGLDSIYPTRHADIAIKMQELGGLVSEYPIGVKADARLFPARNRIIAALSDALIVVEAAKKGGALITANIAYSYEIPLFAVPGELGKSYSEGCNDLIRNYKASIYTNTSDIIESLHWDLEEATKREPFKRDLTHLSREQKEVVQTLIDNGQEMGLDDLSWKSQIPLNKLATILLELEFEHVVKPLPGKSYRLT